MSIKMSEVLTTPGSIVPTTLIPEQLMPTASVPGQTKSQRGDKRTRSLTIRELACNLRDAVVAISGQIVFLDPGGIPALITQRGNGFFIKGHYIICPANLVLIGPKTGLKRLPPSLIQSENGYSNQFIRVSRILVDVSNVNGSGHSYSYEADIVGLDGAANLAVLRINPTKAWNINNPSIRVCHPILQWGKSRNSCSGDTVILIGNICSPASITGSDTTLAVAENAITLGILSDNRYVFPGGQVPGELLLLSNILPHGEQQGLPIITTHGTVIGMTVHVYDSYTYNIGLSEFFMRLPVKALIRSYQDKCIPERYQGFITLISDPIGDYYVFNKSWIGIAGILMDAQDYDTTINITSRAPIAEGDALTHLPCCKEILGYRVLAVAGELPTEVFIPGNSPPNSLIPTLSLSPAYGIINRGDIITHLNGCPLGDRKGQISPSLVMWRIQPGAKVKISYRKQTEQFEHTHEVIVHTQSYQPFLDFPFYSRFQIPLQGMLPTLL